ncbi:MAG TPA: DUF2723 domain-containing protein [Bacteroidia bacterium]|nr:DUF2723 domain-containing protein [Bacteroidia bacterium]
MELIGQKYRRFNTILGWLVFCISAWVYWSTIEPTASFWDCSEFISVDYKLQIGHPPGAPFLQLVAHLISLLTFGNVQKVAPYINRVSATCSALTILFLFWTITWFARKIVSKKGQLNDSIIIIILGAGLIGSLAYTFSDSFWFSAVEGEVYAMSSCFTAMVFWCITKWERADQFAERWIVFIFYLIGLSIGVHLLCLLTIPAVVFVYYFKQYPEGINLKWFSVPLSFITKKPREQGAIIAGIIAIVLLGSIQAIVIPGILQVATSFELFFVNKLGMHFESGTLIYAASITIVIVAGLYLTRHFNKPGWNIAILAFTMLVVGYSSFLILVIRSNAHTPMDENHPSDAINLHAYLGRQQYGDWPLLYGQYYTAPLDTAKPYKDGEPVYAKDEKTGRYVVTNDMKEQEPNYDTRFCTFFPRMYDAGEGHPDGYKNWGDTTMDRILFTEKGGRKRIIEKPIYLDNFRYFIRYQVNFMFWKYFMWNFCGRQNDIQGYDSDDKLHGNWITGISFIDSMMGIPQKDIPEEYSKNKANNTMCGLPLLLGLFGFIYQLKKDRANALVILVFFFFTGLAIVLYLNQTPYQPRERDYSYVGAFYAFAIWIGLGVLAIFDFLSTRIKNQNPAHIAFGVVVFAMIVPMVMAHAEWNDHDRSGRYVCRDMAIDYLESCAPNAILFCNGDNDTFPLWYAQEVEGIRRDVRVCNLSLLAGSWYIDQMKRRTYESAPLPFSMTHEQYMDGTRDYLPILRSSDSVDDLRSVVDFFKSDDHEKQIKLESGKYINYLPTNYFKIIVNKEQVLKNSVVPVSMEDSIVSSIEWKLPGSYVEKNIMIVLDLLAHDDWSRPIYFTTFAGTASYMGLEKYFQLEGLAYRLVPLKKDKSSADFDTRVATDIMYNNVIHKFRWGNMGSGVYLDENARRMAEQLRTNIGTLAQSLIDENKKDSALKVLNLCVGSIPSTNYPYDTPMILIDYCYYEAGDIVKGNKLAKKMFDDGELKLKYFATLDTDPRNYYGYEGGQVQANLQKLALLVQAFNQKDLFTDFSSRLDAMLNAHIISRIQQ